MISDEQLDKYLDSNSIKFKKWMAKIESDELHELFLPASKLSHFEKMLKIKVNIQVKELLMSILHFCCYSVKDASRLASTHYDLILDKLTSFENMKTYMVAVKMPAAPKT